MKHFDMLAFDLDGTLIDSSVDLAASVNHALSTLGLAAITVEDVKRYVGDGVAVLMKRALGRQADEFFPQAIELFRDYYEGHLLDHTVLYPDVVDFFSYFGDKKKILVTNKTEKYTLKILQSLRINDYFLDVYGEDSTPFKKPDPRLLELAMGKRGVSPERTVMIGDGVNDILLAQGPGVVSCAFLNGIGDREKLIRLQPDIVCESLSELKSFFC